MNNRLNELSEQAIKDSNKELEVNDPDRYYSDKGPDWSVVSQKLAELVLNNVFDIMEKEFNSIAAHSTGPYNGPDIPMAKAMAIANCEVAIKLHFGVI